MNDIELKNKLAAIAAILGGQISFPHEHTDNATIDLGNERRFFVRHYKGKLTVYGLWPKSKVDGHIFAPGYGEPTPEISASATKTPEKIANDIKNRFLPDYETLVAQKIERRNNQDAYTNSRTQTADKIAEIMGNERGYYYGDVISLDAAPYSNDKVEVKITGLSIEQFRKIWEMVKE